MERLAKNQQLACFANHGVGLAFSLAMLARFCKWNTGIILFFIRILGRIFGWLKHFCVINHLKDPVCWTAFTWRVMLGGWHCNLHRNKLKLLFAVPSKKVKSIPSFILWHSAHISDAMRQRWVHWLPSPLQNFLEIVLCSKVCNTGRCEN